MKIPSEIKALTQQFDFISIRESLDWPALNLPPERLIKLCQYLKIEWEYDMLVDLTAVDWSGASPRFTCIYHLYSTLQHKYIRLASDCSDDQNPTMPSLCAVWPAADWHEREVFDMFGIQFLGHPNLKRILMWDGYPHFPLRKEFPLAGIEGDLPAEDVARETQAKVIAAPMMGGPFRAPQCGSMKMREPQALDESWTEQQVKPEGDC